MRLGWSSAYPQDGAKHSWDADTPFRLVDREAAQCPVLGYAGSRSPGGSYRDPPPVSSSNQTIGSGSAQLRDRRRNRVWDQYWPLGRSLGRRGQRIRAQGLCGVTA
jgi:hypothetical protein